MERRPIARAAVVIMLGNLVTSLLGFSRQFVTARYFGASGDTDAWFAAYTVPQMFYDLIIGGAIAAALIPSFTRLSESDGQAFWRAVRTIFVLAGLVLLIVVGVLELAARPMMVIVASGFVKHSGRLDLSVKLVRIILPTLLFWGLSAVSLAALYSLGKRVAASFATACFHIGIIVAAIVLASPLGILALPVGAVAGAATQFLVQIPSLWRSWRAAGVRLARHVDLRDPAVRKILTLYAPVAAGIVVSIVGQIADINFKSHLGGNGGKLSAMQYATTLIQFPVGIVVAALGLAVLPFISRDALAGRIDDLKDKLALGFRVVLVIMIPAAVGFATLGHEIVALLLQHRNFTATGTDWTTTALLGYAPQLPFIGIDQLLIFAFYARHNTVTPMLVGVFGVGVYVVAAFILLGPLSIIGLALANTIQIALHAAVLAFLLVRAIGGLGRRALVSTAVKVGTASAVMGVAVHLAALAITSHPLGRYSAFWAVLLPMLLAVGVYGGLLLLFRVEEIKLVQSALLTRLRDRSIVVQANSSSP
jgi:putative peptidoglycan lipid II flippase